MKPKRTYLIIVGLLIVIATTIFLWPGKEAPQIDARNIAASAIIDYPAQYNYSQTFNDCGPFNVAAVVRSLTKKEVSSSEYAESIPWRMPNGYTLPWGLEKQLKNNDIQIEVPNLAALSGQDKVLFLRERLSQGKPVIILGERDSIQHFVTIFGFSSSSDEFYVYDSLFDQGNDGLTIDANDSLPGNRNYTSGALLDFWRGGGMGGKFMWYAIVGGL